MSSKDATYEFSKLDVELSRAELYRAYWVEEKSVNELAEEFGISRTSLYRAFQALDIPRRGQNKADKIRREKLAEKRKYWDEEYIHREYVEKGKTVSEIADECDVSTTTIRKWIKRHGFDLPDRYYDIPEFCMSCESNSHTSYPHWHGCDGQMLTVHQLVAVAEGADPYKVYNNSAWNIDHKNRHKCDNSHHNLELISSAEHGLKEYERNISWSQSFDEDDLRFAIKFMLNPSAFEL